MHMTIKVAVSGASGYVGGEVLRVFSAHPEVEFLGPCNMCPYMKKITLEKVLWSLHTMTGAGVSRHSQTALAPSSSLSGSLESRRSR